MLISTVSWDEWDGNLDRGDAMAVTPWDEVRSKIESLDGHIGDYAGRLYVELPIVLRAARLFGETGEVERSFWERDDVLEFA